MRRLATEPTRINQRAFQARETEPRVFAIGLSEECIVDDGRARSVPRVRELLEEEGRFGGEFGVDEGIDEIVRIITAR